jgi:hypothetical protein
VWEAALTLLAFYCAVDVTFRNRLAEVPDLEPGIDWLRCRSGAPGMLEDRPCRAG